MEFEEMEVTNELLEDLTVEEAAVIEHIQGEMSRYVKSLRNVAEHAEGFSSMFDKHPPVAKFFAQVAIRSGMMTRWQMTDAEPSVILRESREIFERGMKTGAKRVVN